MDSMSRTAWRGVTVLHGRRLRLRTAFGFACRHQAFDSAYRQLPFPNFQDSSHVHHISPTNKAFASRIFPLAPVRREVMLIWYASFLKACKILSMGPGKAVVSAMS